MTIGRGFSAWIATTVAVPLLALFLGPVAAGQGNSKPVVTIDGKRVIASNFSPGSTLVFYAVYIAGDGYSTATRSQTFRVTDDDKNGSVEIEVPGKMPFRSVWIAVDERNGEYAVVSPAGYQTKAGPPPSLRKHGSAVDEIGWPGYGSYLLYVHPGKGAWTGQTFDGNTSDADGRADYVTSFALAALRPVVAGNSDKPADLTPGGTLFIVDAFSLKTFVAKVDGGLLNGAR